MGHTKSSFILLNITTFAVTIRVHPVALQAVLLLAADDRIASGLDIRRRWESIFCGTINAPDSFAAIRADGVPALELGTQVVAVVCTQETLVVVLAHSGCIVQSVSGSATGRTGAQVRPYRVVATLTFQTIVCPQLTLVYV